MLLEIVIILPVIEIEFDIKGRECLEQIINSTSTLLIISSS